MIEIVGRTVMSTRIQSRKGAGQELCRLFNKQEKSYDIG